MQSVYPTWEAYLARYLEVGGVIEAAPSCGPGEVERPSIAIDIQPDGVVALQASFDRFEATPFINAGCFYPQTNLPTSTVNDLAEKLGELLYRKGVIGPVTVDLVSFPDRQNADNPYGFWALDLSFGLSNEGLAASTFDMLLEGNFEEDEGEYMIEVFDGGMHPLEGRPSAAGESQPGQSKPSNVTSQSQSPQRTPSHSKTPSKTPSKHSKANKSNR